MDRQPSTVVGRRLIYLDQPGPMGSGGGQKIFSVFDDIARKRKHYSGYILKAFIPVRLILPIAA
jgi:hypothetical protein